MRERERERERERVKYGPLQEVIEDKKRHYISTYTVEDILGLFLVCLASNIVHDISLPMDVMTDTTSGLLKEERNELIIHPFNYHSFISLFLLVMYTHFHSSKCNALIFEICEPSFL